jgi:hypothetical protein
MKYTRGSQTWKIEGQPYVKFRLTDGDDFTETPWGVSSPDGKEFVLVNNAIAFTPYFSWGAVFDKTSFNFLPILENKELTLHPESYDFAVKEGAIDENGFYVEEDKRVKQ